MVRLKRVGREDLAIRLVRHGRGFGLRDADGETVSDPGLHQRVRSLGIPPAWTDVRIAVAPNAHIQALGTDAAGRTQYVYHPDWEARRTRHKLEQLARLTEALPRIRRHVHDDLREPAGSKRLALALGVALIDRTAMRVGRERYLDARGTRGAGTLFARDVSVAGDVVTTRFPSKSGKQASYEVRDGRLAEAVRKVKSIHGRRLLMYRDDAGVARPLRTDDINRYLRAIGGTTVTAKDFRTLHASALAAEYLARLAPAESMSGRKRQMAAVTRQVAAFLQNTPAICRASYVAPCLYALFDKGRLGAIWAAGGAGTNGVRQREVRLAAVLAAAG
ncbi:MAG: DNA topoisomerase IB [Devosia sp.]|uniref:DNA topoisomerase IB n=1 Tax=Devosia sp. TaxID=1871048 RepID=UPI001AD34C05|nr:DNA topoisomerase IB [Devosia sp.]MBN9308804.1 DNA topoisomerase IB [Devosia sp.]MBN9315600.1 DNA topoisomerase IB [Devosia sp.]